MGDRRDEGRGSRASRHRAGGADGAHGVGAVAGPSRAEQDLDEREWRDWLEGGDDRDADEPGDERWDGPAGRAGTRGRGARGGADPDGDSWREETEATWWWQALTRRGRGGSPEPGRTRWRIGVGAAVCAALALVFAMGWLGWRGASATPDGTAVPVRAGEAAGAGETPDAGADGAETTSAGTGVGAQPDASPTASAPPAGTAVGTAATGPDVVVHVAGEVKRPGVVRLRGGSRVADAVAAVGGTTRRADQTSVNLARPVVDGEQIVIARRGATTVSPGIGAAAGGADAGGAAAGGSASAGGDGTGTSGAAGSLGTGTSRVDLNAATAEQLQSLPGVGPKRAEAIVQWRQDHGRFSRVEELMEISGIGEKTFASLKDLVQV